MTTLPQTAAELCRAIAEGRLKPSEVMAATLDRIEAVNPKVNAIVALRPRADLMAEAETLDRTQPRGALFGLPMAVKDLQATKGLRTTMGSPIYADHVPTEDDLLPRRLREAGAIIIGKTNTPEMGLGSHTYNPVYGATRNPWNPERTAGGSSGGAAVALATGMLPLADGSDMMGSLRNPAAWCGVYGLRPTFGLVPEDPGADKILHQISTDGPLARNPADLTLLLDVLAAPDPRWPHSVTRLSATPGLDGKRIGWLADWGGAWPFEDGILPLCEAALARMEAAGATVERVAPPIPRNEVWDAWITLRSLAVAAGNEADYRSENARAQMKEALVWEIERGLALSAADIRRASATRARLFTALAELFADFDALALPTTQVWPFPVERVHPTEIAGVRMDTYHRWMECMTPVSLTGLPALSVPIGFGPQGLPMGMQLIGPRGGDDRLIALASAWHDTSEWRHHTPPV